MSRTLLQLIDQASGEMGLQQPPAIMSSTVNQTMQLLALAQRLGADLMREHEWQRLVKAYVFTTTAAVSTTGNTSSGSAVVSSIPDTTSLSAGDVVSGTGIPTFAEILTVDSSTQVTLNQTASAAGTAVTLTFAKQDYSLPSDFDRMVVDSNWDRTDHRMNQGAKSSQEWQWLQGGSISTAFGARYRLYGNKLRIFTALTAATTLAYEYVSNLWVLASGGTAPTKSAFSIDSDTCVFPDDLMLAGLKYYFLRAKKLDYGIEMAEFENIKSTRKGQDVPASKKSLAPTYASDILGSEAIPDGSWSL